MAVALDAKICLFVPVELGLQVRTSKWLRESQLAVLISLCVVGQDFCFHANLCSNCILFVTYSEKKMNKNH